MSTKTAEDYIMKNASLDIKPSWIEHLYLGRLNCSWAAGHLTLVALRRLGTSHCLSARGQNRGVDQPGIIDSNFYSETYLPSRIEVWSGIWHKKHQTWCTKEDSDNQNLVSPLTPCYPESAADLSQPLPRRTLDWIWSTESRWYRQRGLGSSGIFSKSMTTSFTSNFILTMTNTATIRRNPPSSVVPIFRSVSSQQGYSTHVVLFEMSSYIHCWNT